MSVNERPVIRWYAATLIFRCTVDGRDGNPFSGGSNAIPAVQREVMLLRSHSPDAAYDLAVERANYRARADFHGSALASGETVAWEFAGLEDLQELPLHETNDGVVAWSRCVKGIPASELVYPKEALSIFCRERGFWTSRADSHDPQDSKAGPG